VVRGARCERAVHKSGRAARAEAGGGARYGMERRVVLGAPGRIVYTFIYSSPVPGAVSPVTPLALVAAALALDAPMAALCSSSWTTTPRRSPRALGRYRGEAT